MDVASDHELNPDLDKADLEDPEEHEKETPAFSVRCISFWKSFNSCYQALLLGLVVLVYLVIGAAIFVAIEAPFEQQQIDNIQSTRQQIVQNLSETYNLTEEEVTVIVSRFSMACQNDLLVDDTVRIWNFGNAIFFATTVITTIGYGNLSPSTERGQSFCVFYALFGIPITVAFLAILGQLLGHLPKLILEKLKDKAKYFRWIAIASVVLLGLVLFLFIPAAIFSVIEGWSYRQSTYYAFITLSTIGFGDLVAAQQDDRPADPALRQFYGVCVSVWIYIGLAFLAIVLTDVGGAMSSLGKSAHLGVQRRRKRAKMQREMRELSSAEEKQTESEPTKDAYHLEEASTEHSETQPPEEPKAEAQSETESKGEEHADSESSPLHETGQKNNEETESVSPQEQTN